MGEVEIAENIELISGSVKLRQEKKIIIAAYYRPPRRTDSDYTVYHKKSGGVSQTWTESKTKYTDHLGGL